nr:zinc finger protein 502-like [Aedes albopictus]
MMETNNYVTITETDNSSEIVIKDIKHEIETKDEYNSDLPASAKIKQETPEIDDYATKFKSGETSLETKIEYDETMVNISKEATKVQTKVKPKQNSYLKSTRDEANQRHQCGKYYQKFSTYLELLHQNHDYETVRIYHCGYESCSQTFKTANFLLRHIQVRHGSCRKAFACGLCGQKFESAVDFERHRDSQHQNRLLCNICEESFQSEKDVVEHYKTGHGGSTEPIKPLPKNVISTPYERANLMKKDARIYVCQICSNEFLDVAQAKHHVNHDHANVKRRSCDKCGRTFRRRAGMIRHSQISQSCGDPAAIPRKFVCKFCDKAFQQEAVLKRHSALHADQDPDFKGHICDLCGKAFTMYRHYQEHKDRHEKIRPFQCPDCGKGFFDRSARNRHERTGVCPNQMVLCCVDCDEEFGSVLKLAEHVCPGMRKADDGGPTTAN